MNNAPEKIYVSLHDEYDEPIDLETEMPTEFTTVPYEGPNWEYIRADLVPQWQCIDTAPKDESIFLGYWPANDLNHRIQPSVYVNHPNYMCFVQTSDYDAGDRLTHWMPLPKGPTE